MWMPSPNQYWIRSKFNATSFSSRSFTIGSIEPTCSITWSLGSRNFWKQNILDQYIVEISTANNFFSSSVNLFSKKIHSIWSVIRVFERREPPVEMWKWIWINGFFVPLDIIPNQIQVQNDELNEFFWLAHIYICCFSKKQFRYLSDDNVIEWPVCTTSIDQPNRFLSVFIKSATASGFMHHLNQSSTHFFNLFWKQLLWTRNWLCLSPEHPANEFHSCETKLRNRKKFFGPIELWKSRI